MGKINKKLEKDLFSVDKIKVLDAIEFIRREGNINYIKPLAIKLRNSKDEEINKKLASIFNDLKDKNSIEIIMDLINDIEFESIKKTLISSCWQNSLSFQNHFLEFVNFVINEDFETSIEAFSVIDDMEDQVSKENLIKGKESIRKVTGNYQDDKLNLLKELYKHIDNILESKSLNL